MLFVVLLLLASWMSLIGLAAGQAGLAAFGTAAGLLLIAWRLRRRSMRRSAATTPPPAAKSKDADEFDSVLLRDAIRLCHPDAHPPERRELANAVTASLMALRERR